MATKPVTRLTEQDYLDLDRAAEYKSEFVGGEMYAMSGGTMRHASLGGNTYAHFKTLLKGSRCTAFNSDVRVRAKNGEYFYPDVTVVCGPPQTHSDSKDICTNPALIVEVLSPSTAAYDRGLKFQLYRTIQTLKDYLMIHCDAPYVEHYSRQADDSWVLREYHGETARLPLPNLECELSLGEIYEGGMELPG